MAPHPKATPPSNNPIMMRSVIHSRHGSQRRALFSPFDDVAPHRDGKGHAPHGGPPRQRRLIGTEPLS
jgi:hypothetical protein